MKHEQLMQYMGKKIPGTSLTLLEDLGIKEVYGSRRRVYRFLCDCGNTKEYCPTKNPKTCAAKNCPYFLKNAEETRQNVVKHSNVSNRNRHNDSILLENREHGFVLIKGRYNKYMLEAKKRGLQWQLEPQDIESMWIQQEGKCKQTGLQLSCGTNNHNQTWSLDRIDNSKPYTKDNVQIVSKTYNMMKGSRTDNEMKLMAYLLYQNMSVQEVRIYNTMDKNTIERALQDCTKTNRKQVI